MNNFTDRISQYPKRKKLTIISQNENEMVVDVDRLDGEVSQIGTEIKAENFNNLKQEVENIKNILSNLQITSVTVNGEHQKKFNADNKANISDLPTVDGSTIVKNGNQLSAFQGYNSLVDFGELVNQVVSAGSGIKISQGTSSGSGLVKPKRFITISTLYDSYKSPTTTGDGSTSNGSGINTNSWIIFPNGFFLYTQFLSCKDIKNGYSVSFNGNFLNNFTNKKVNITYAQVNTNRSGNGSNGYGYIYSTSGLYGISGFSVCFDSSNAEANPRGTMLFCFGHGTVV